MKEARHGVTMGVTMGLLLGLSACSNMMGSGNTPRATAMTQPTVAPEMVRQVQSKLRDDGYYRQGSVDGVWGLGTEAAVRSFQHDHNLGSSGQLDVPTLQALNLGTTNAAAAGPALNQPLHGDPSNPSANNVPGQDPTLDDQRH